MAKRGKNYRHALTKVDREKLYEPRSAIELVKEINYTTFDATVEVHMRLGVDPRHADQQVRGVVLFPHGLGKTVRVLVFAQGDAARAAANAGADYIADDDEMLKQIQDGWVDFDVALAVPEMMGRVGRLGRVLGPRGLMPSPKAGTIAQEDDLPRLIEEAKAGRVDFRVDRTSNVHAPIGKISFDVDMLLDNMTAFVDVIKKARPPSAKGSYIRKMTVTDTMGPGVKVDPIAAQALELA
jgi:large subunit ribosomal protein L1